MNAKTEKKSEKRSRARKKSTNPTRIYTYGAFAPTAAADVVDRQFLKARRYKNELIAIERDRRAEVRAAQAKNTAVAAQKDNIEKLKKQREELRSAIKMLNASARDKKTNRERVATLKTQAQAVTQQLKQEYDVLKKVKEAEKKALLPHYQAADERAKERIREARGKCDVYWGTSGLIEEEVRQAAAGKDDPVHRKWDGRGRIGVQFQKSQTDPDHPKRPRINGAPVADLYKNFDNRMRIIPASGELQTIKTKNGKRIQRYDRKSRVLMRVGTIDNAPLWAEFPVIFHRPLPKDSVIKYAWIRRTRVGKKYRYELQMFVESPSFRAQPREGERVIALDVGWRLDVGDTLDDPAALRLAAWYDNQGNNGYYQLHTVYKKRYERTFALRSQRDENFNKVRGNLAQWLENNEVPEWLAEATAYIKKWCATARLYKVAQKWRFNRFKGDEVIFPAIEAWRRQEKHLHEWEANLRDKLLAAREHFYKEVSADLAERYDRIVLENFDLRSVTKKQKPESNREDAWAAARRQRFETSINKFRTLLKTAAAKTGAQIIEVSAALTTKICHECSSVEIWNQAKELRHTCNACGINWDQDDNAAVNIYHRSARASVA